MRRTLRPSVRRRRARHRYAGHTIAHDAGVDVPVEVELEAEVASAMRDEADRLLFEADALLAETHALVERLAAEAVARAAAELERGREAEEPAEVRVVIGKITPRYAAGRPLRWLPAAA
ncbi:MAG: hypothetical protein AAF823_09580 [Planctomycetota bacterium]